MHFYSSIDNLMKNTYLKRQIGVDANEENEVIAFCSLMPTYFNDATLEYLI